MRIEKSVCFGFIYGLFVFMLIIGYDVCKKLCEKLNLSFEVVKYILNMSKIFVVFIVWFELKRECVINFKLIVVI